MNKPQVAGQKSKWKKPMSVIEDRPNSRPSAEQTRANDKVRALAADQSSAGNVDRIRDILFGTQMRDYETRFARLEETLLKESQELKESTRRRFETLEAYVKKELEALQGRLKAEREERSDSTKGLSRDLKDLNENLSRRLAELDERTSDGDRELRDQILTQAKSLAEEAQSRYEALTALLNRRHQELRESKTDRAALADLFTEVAMRLSDEFKVPGIDA